MACEHVLLIDMTLCIIIIDRSQNWLHMKCVFPRHHFYSEVATAVKGYHPRDQSVKIDFLLVKITLYNEHHLKLGFLDKSVSKRFMEASLKLNVYAQLGFAWLSAKCYK